jgi:UDP-N-acetylmuramate--alanine ligase
MTVKIDILPDSLHFVGVGGIGMSGLAQMALSLGRKVSGSDRALENPENARIIDSLRAQGVRLYPQDGSVHAESAPGALVYSTAIEEDNQDFKLALPGTVRLHRSEAMALAFKALGQGGSVAVTGSCGKTSVSCWLAEALENLGQSPTLLSGGLSNRFGHDGLAGNFRRGSGPFSVLEADESDKSLLNYSSDYALVLNIGTDHYSKEELARVFREFLRKVAKGAVVEAEAFKMIGPEGLEHLDLRLISLEKGPSEIAGRKVLRLDSYRVEGGRPLASFGGLKEIALPGPGLHNAANAMAVFASLSLLGLDDAEAMLKATSSFSGVWRRFEFAGRSLKGAPVYDDYAHNVEKMLSCIDAARSLCGKGGGVKAIFQPHGYGPWGFMREELHPALEACLRPEDCFGVLPVFYAGGTSSFKPTSEEVVSGYLAKGGRGRYIAFKDRPDAEAFIDSEASPSDVVLVMGARDNSLSIWARRLAKAD